MSLKEHDGVQALFRVLAGLIPPSSLEQSCRMVWSRNDRSKLIHSIRIDPVPLLVGEAIACWAWAWPGQWPSSVVLWMRPHGRIPCIRSQFARYLRLWGRNFPPVCQQNDSASSVHTGTQHNMVQHPFLPFEQNQHQQLASAHQAAHTAETFMYGCNAHIYVPVHTVSPFEACNQQYFRQQAVTVNHFSPVQGYGQQGILLFPANQPNWQTSHSQTRSSPAESWKFQPSYDMASVKPAAFSSQPSVPSRIQTSNQIQGNNAEKPRSGYCPPASQPRQLPYHWVYSANKSKAAVPTFLNLSPHDKYYYDNNHKVQRLGFRFAESLCPQKLAQSMQMAVEAYPVAGSKVIMHDGKPRFEFGAEQVKVQLVQVETGMLRCITDLEQLCDILCPPAADARDLPLLSAFLFKTLDARDGSVLVCGFEHTAGDAMSYSLFMRRWSEEYEKLAALAPDTRVPDGVFAAYSRLDPHHMRDPAGPAYHHFSFSVEALGELKRAALAGSMEMVSSNDVLCAQCSLAIAPFRLQQSETQERSALVRIYILVDARGRNVPVGAFGNHVEDVAVDVTWEDLLQRTDDCVLWLATKIRGALREQTSLLASDPKEFYAQRVNRRQADTLLCWNSWARVGEHLRQAQFRSSPPPPPPISSAAPVSAPSSLSLPKHVGASNLTELCWFNARWFPDPSTVVVEPTADGRVVVHVASCRDVSTAELEALSQWWSGASLQED